MIKSFRHKGLERFFGTGSKAGIQPVHAARLRVQLGRLNTAIQPDDMNLPGWRLHRLQGDTQGRWSVRIDANWRLTFAFIGNDAAEVDYLDYH